MLSRPCGVKPIPKVDDDRPAGTFFKVGGTPIQVYVPSWVKSPEADRQMVPLTSSPKSIASATKAFCAMSNDAQCFKAAYDVQLLLEQQRRLHPWTDPQSARGKSDEELLEKCFKADDDIHKWLRRHSKKLHINNLGLLCNDGKVVLPVKSITSWLRQAHDSYNHSGIERVKQSLAHVDWSSKGPDIADYVNSCIACARRKGNYGRQPPWRIGHVKRGTKPFEIVFCDFITLPPCKGKRYACTLLCSFSRFFMAIPSKNETAPTLQTLYTTLLTP